MFLEIFYERVLALTRLFVLQKETPKKNPTFALVEDVGKHHFFKIFLV